jgi:5'-nucleotidase
MKLSMRTFTTFTLGLAIAFSASTVSALNIVVTNDDGAEASTVIAMQQRLIAAGHSAIVCASTQDKSGTGGQLDFLKPITPMTATSRAGFIKAGAPGVGLVPGLTDVYYVDSTPVASALYCLDVASFKKWNAVADLVVSGPNYGNNTGLINNSSGTVNAGLIALNRGVPAIVVSAAKPSSYKAFDKLVDADPEYEVADIIVKILKELIVQKSVAGGALLPPGVALNVNTPAFDTGKANALPLKFTQVGVAASAVPFFVEDLSTDPIAVGYGLGAVKFPGITLGLPTTGVPAKLSSIKDTDPNSEQNAVLAGSVAISVIKGNHQAGRAAESALRLKLQNIAK